MAANSASLWFHFIEFWLLLWQHFTFARLFSNGLMNSGFSSITYKVENYYSLKNALIAIGWHQLAVKS